MSRNNDNRNQVAKIEPVRMEMPANVAEDYALSKDSWRALVDAVFPNAQSVGAVTMALAYCKKNHLDIFQRPVHIVPMWNGNRMIETVWPGIAQLRIVAQRQEDYAGYDDCEFGPMVENAKFSGKARGSNNSTYSVDATVSYPEWAQFTVYKMLHGQRVALKGPKVYWLEAFSNKATSAGQCPNEMWAKRPIGQLEKCAEAAAWRRAFPDVLGNEYAMEEMEGRDLRSGQAIEGQYTEVREEGREERAVPKERPRQQDYERSAPTAAKEEPGEQVQDDHHSERQTREQMLQDERRQEPSEPEADTPPPGWNEETKILEEGGVPSKPQEWNHFITMVRKRLDRLHTEAHINDLQSAQQWRIDKAPPGVQSELLELFADAVANLDPLPEDDDGTNEDGGNSEETTY